MNGTVNVMTKIKSLDVSDYLGSISIIILLIIFRIINPNFLTPRNMTNILMDASSVLALGIALTFVLLIGSIDLSVGAVSSCASVIFAVSLMRFGSNAYGIVLGFGALAGLISGFLYVKLQVPSFIITFGTMGIWQSVALLISRGGPIQIERQNWNYFNWLNVKLGIIPIAFLTGLFFLIIMLVIEKKTAFGRSMYAIGANERGARMMGINVPKTKILVFMISGIFASMAGIIFSFNLKSGIPTVGEPFTLLSIAAVALGGTSLSGGRGGLLKTLAGVFLVVLIQNGMNVIGVSAFWQQVTFGCIVLIAIYFTTDRRRRDFIVK